MNATAGTRPWQEILFSRRMLVCIFIGFSSGMPLYVLIQLVPAWLRSEGIDLATIGLFSLVALPYTWKFLWSPLMDRFRLPFLGRRRGPNRKLAARPGQQQGTHHTDNTFAHHRSLPTETATEDPVSGVESLTAPGR